MLRPHVPAEPADIPAVPAMTQCHFQNRSLYSQWFTPQTLHWSPTMVGCCMILYLFTLLQQTTAQSTRYLGLLNTLSTLSILWIFGKFWQCGHIVGAFNILDISNILNTCQCGHFKLFEHYWHCGHFWHFWHCGHLGQFQHCGHFVCNENPFALKVVTERLPFPLFITTAP